MAFLYLVLALSIQSAFISAEIDDNHIESREILKVKPEDDDDVIKEFSSAPKDWMDMFLGSNNHLFPTSSAALMAQATFSDKSPEEQLEDIKEMAKQITMAIQSEMANLLSYAIAFDDKNQTDNKLRKKRSIESPMDSSQLVMRLLKHIKSNNDYQNIAIEKMMTAQEIADKYGINFTPDPEVLSDLAVAANEQAQEMTEILKEACDTKNASLHQIMEKHNIQTGRVENTIQNCSELYNTNEIPTDKILEQFHYNEPSLNNQYPESHSHYNYYNIHPETQVLPPPTHYHNPPVSKRPSFYESISFSPEEYYPYCSVDPISTTFIVPIEEPEPEVVGEEFEETVSSKVYIDHEAEPGAATVNHVMTYTLAEKTHFRTPQIESLPQQLQYYFFLM